MQHFERIWQRGLFGKVVLILLGFLVLLIVVGIPVGVIVTLTDVRGRSASPTLDASKAVTANPSSAAIQQPTTLVITPTLIPVPSPSSSLTTTLPTSQTILAVQLTITDTNDFVNVRNGPGLTYTVVGRINKGQTAAVIGKNGDATWWQIDMNGTRGWVYGPLVILKGNPNAVPVVKGLSLRRVVFARRG